MTFELKPCPKPASRVKAKPPRTRLKRSPMKKTKMRCGAGSKRRGKSSFPKQRDRKYRRWVWTENSCMLRGHLIRRRFSEHDMIWPEWSANPRDLVHVCWGAITPAHAGDTQARGAPDFGVLIPLCEAAHRFYDNRRFDWRKATGYTEHAMASAASGYALKYVEQGGISAPQGQKENT